MKIKSIVVSWDFILGVFIFIISIILLPDFVLPAVAYDLYSVGVSTIALIFSIYFASIAFIFASGDDDFITFLQENNSYEALIHTYKYTLLVLFITLALSLIFLVLNKFIQINYLSPINSKWLLSFNFSLTFYSLGCVVTSAWDSLNFAKYRTKFMLIKKNS